MFSPQILSILLAFGATLSSSSLAYAHTIPHTSRADCGTYTISGISGGFTSRAYTDFTTATAGSNATAFLSEKGFSISDYSVDSTPIAHTFTPDNVALSTVDGFTALDLKTSAYTSGNVTGASVSTDITFTYASVRTVLKSSSTKGIVEGNFFYLDDTQETDIEILTATALTSSSDVEAGILVTNQATTAGGNKTTQTVPFSFDPSADFHEYRLDWVSGSTTFYIDGSQIAKLTTNVPSQAGSWFWNVWSSGDPTFSAGPPTSDAHTYIKSTDVYTGYTSSASGTTCSI